MYRDIDTPKTPRLLVLLSSMRACHINKSAAVAIRNKI